MNKNKDLGNRGEEIAKSYLEANGYSFIEKNYRAGRRELDLIFSWKDKLIFIEVKTRIKTYDSVFENPLSKRQVENLKKAIAEYCFKKHACCDKIRLDLISILIDKEKRCAQLKHYKNVF